MNKEEEIQLNLDFIEKWRERINQGNSTNRILDFYKAILELILDINSENNKGYFDKETPPKTLFSSVNSIMKSTTQTNNSDNFNYFIEKYLPFGVSLSEEAKAYLSESILKNENENKNENKNESKQKRATQVYLASQDVHSLTILLEIEIEKMTDIRLEIQGI